jgi:lipopolysaccharide export system protein LptA
MSETMIVGGVAIAMSLETELPISVQSSKTSLKQTIETGIKDGETKVTQDRPGLHSIPTLPH